MKDRFDVIKAAFSRTCLGILVCLLLILIAPIDAAGAAEAGRRAQTSLNRVPSPRTALNLKDIPFKIVYETYRRTDDKYNWELFMINADGSGKVNLTNTPDLDEMYPHVSPDATKISFVVDEGTGRDKIRNVYYKIRSVYYMNIDGTERVKVARNAREPCWGPD